jgi:hypothetical protein
MGPPFPVEYSVDREEQCAKQKKSFNRGKSLPQCRALMEVLHVEKRVGVCPQPVFRTNPPKHAPNSHDCLSAFEWS